MPPDENCVQEEDTDNMGYPIYPMLCVPVLKTPDGKPPACNVYPSQDLTDDCMNKKFLFQNRSKKLQERTDFTNKTDIL